MAGSWSSRRWKSWSRKCVKVCYQHLPAFVYILLNLYFFPFSRDWRSRGQAYQREPVAHLQDPPPEVQIYLRPVLSEKSHQPGVVRLLHPGEDCRCESDSQMEEGRIREPLLLAMHPDEGHEFRDKLHLPGAQGETGGGPCGRMCSLWLSGVFRVVSQNSLIRNKRNNYIWIIE